MTTSPDKPSSPALPPEPASGTGVTTPDPPGERRARREDRSRRAVAAAVAVARDNGLQVEEPIVLADLFSVMVHLHPAPVVARVSTWTPTLRTPITDWLTRELAVTTYLSQQGAPVVGPSRELPPGPHSRDGFAISFWTYVQPDPDRIATMADCSAMLVDLHAALRSYPGELPVLAPAVNDIPYGLAGLDQAGDLLKPADADLLRTAAEQLGPFMAAPGDDLQPLHGDVHPGNVIATRDGLLWIDFEEVCRGPVEWDLALLDTAGAGGGSGVVARHHRPDPETLARCKRLRALHLVLCLLAYRPDLGDLTGWDEGILAFCDAFPAPRTTDPRP